MSWTPVAISTAERLVLHAVDQDGNPLTGLTDLYVSIYNPAANTWWDWSDSTFKLIGAVAQLEAQLLEVDAVRLPGVYALTWPGTTAGVYWARYRETPGVAVADVFSELRIGQLLTSADIASLTTALGSLATAVADLQARIPAALDNGRIAAAVGAMNANVLVGAAIATDAVTKLQNGLAGAAAVAAVQADVDTIETALVTITGLIDALPTADEINTVLAAAHGSGSWLTATGFAVPGSAMTLTSDQLTAIAEAVAAALAAAHGSGSWLTATGFAVPGSAMTLTAGERTAIAEAWIATAEGSPTRGTLGWNLLRVMQRTENPTELDTVGGGRRLLYNAAGSIVISTQTLRDGSGNMIALPPGSPARIGLST